VHHCGVRVILRQRATALWLLLALAGCGTTPRTTFEALTEEVGSSVADATLVAGTPNSSHAVAGGRRAFVWNRPVLVPTSPQRCAFTAYAVRTGEEKSLAAWQITQIEAPAECLPGSRP
jgi:hypothetical protein